MKNSNYTTGVSKGFTLVELVVVILILAILGAVAAPRLLDTTGEASEASTRQSLSVIRNAIEIHRAKMGALPGDEGTETDFKDDLKQFLQGPFPASNVGNTNDSVRIQSNGTNLEGSGTQGWAYDNMTGQFIVNHETYEIW